MKICIVNAAKMHGGASIVAVDIAKGMSRIGHDVLFVCSGHSNELIYEDGYHVFTLKQSCQSPLFHYFNPAIIWKLYRILREYQPDIVHLHNLNLQTFSLATLFLSLKYPLLWTIHDVWPLCVTGWPAIPDCEGMLTGCKGCNIWPLWIVRANRLLKEMAYKFNRFSVAFPSKWIQGMAMNSYLHDRTSFVINNGIDKKDFRCKKKAVSNEEEKNKIILYCGGRVLAGQSPALRKGWNDFLSAAEIVYESYRNIKILCVGDPIEIQKSVKVPIEFTGGVQRNDMVKFYALADIFVLPTLGDNFPLTVLEAMACRVPIVATSVGGIPEIIEDGVSGMLCDSRDPQSLAKSIIFLLDNPKAGREISRTAYDQFLNEYTLEKMVKGYETAYNFTIKEFYSQ